MNFTQQNWVGGANYSQAAGGDECKCSAKVDELLPQVGEKAQFRAFRDNL